MHQSTVRAFNHIVGTLLVDYRALLADYRALLSDCRTLLHWSTTKIYHTRLKIHDQSARACNYMFGSFLADYRAFLAEYRALFVSSNINIYNEIVRDFNFRPLLAHYSSLLRTCKTIGLAWLITGFFCHTFLFRQTMGLFWQSIGLFWQTADCYWQKHRALCGRRCMIS